MATLLYRVNQKADGTLYVDYPASITSQYDDVNIVLQHNFKTLSYIDVYIENADGVSYNSRMIPDATFSYNQTCSLKTIINNSSFENFSINTMFITFNIVLVDGTELSTGKLNMKLFKSDDDITYTATDMNNVYMAINGFGRLFQSVFKTMSDTNDTTQEYLDKVNALSTSFTEIVESYGKRLDDIEARLTELEK